MRSEGTIDRRGLFRVRALTEADLLHMVQTVGGRKAHPDDDRRQVPGADFVLNEAVIELKALDDEGFEKPERQSKLASLFKPVFPERPVIVLDRDRLPGELQQNYNRIVEGPIKRAVSTARKQLAQSRIEIPEAEVSILLVVNNGYTALDHDSLVSLVAHRVRQDTSAIDGIVVAGCYYYSDGFDTCFLWPINYVPINLKQNFPSFQLFRKAWHEFADNFMTKLVRGELEESPAKYAVVDTAFEVDDTAFVKPAPPMGKESDFYVRGRPRQNSSGIDVSPPVALVFPGLTKDEWSQVHASITDDLGPLSSYEEWQRHRNEAIQESEPVQPLVTMPVAASGWLDWCTKNSLSRTLNSLRLYAHGLFEDRVRRILDGAREKSSIVPSIYVRCVTEVIGQDKANDVSHIAVVREKLDGEAEIRPVAENLRIFHEHALALAAAYAVEEKIDIVVWSKDLRYAWV